MFAPSAFLIEEMQSQIDIAFRLGVELGCSVSTGSELLECLQAADANDIKEKAASVGFLFFKTFFVYGTIK